jgi:hypothetical protein
MSRPEPAPMARKIFHAGTGVARHFRLPDRFADAFAADTGDYRQPASQFIDNDASRLRALLGGQSKYLASMAVGDQPADSLVAGQPAGKAAQLGLINAEILLER